MPSDALDTIRLKTKRAIDHLDDFKAHYFGRSGPVFPPNSIGVHLHEDRKGVTIDTQALKPAQQRWLGIVLGDVIHQLRASLDHIVYALATRPGRPPLTDGEIRHLEFVIREKTRDFDTDWRVTQGWFERIIGRNELATMRAAQPDQRDPIAPETDPLWLLRELDNIDKHRTFVVLQNNIRVGLLLESGTGEIDSRTFHIATTTEPMKPDTQIFSIDYAAPWPIATVSVNSEPTRQIMYAEAGVPGCLGFEVFRLTRLMASTANEVINAFEPFFV